MIIVTCICSAVNAENKEMANKEMASKEMNKVHNQIKGECDTARYTTRYRVTETFLLLCYIPIILLLLVIVSCNNAVNSSLLLLFHSSHAPTLLFILILLLLLLLLLLIPLSLGYSLEDGGRY